MEDANDVQLVPQKLTGGTRILYLYNALKIVFITLLFCLLYEARSLAGQPAASRRRPPSRSSLRSVQSLALFLPLSLFLPLPLFLPRAPAAAAIAWAVPKARLALTNPRLLPDCRYFRGFIQNSFFFLGKKGKYEKIEFIIRTTDEFGTAYDRNVAFLTRNSEFYIHQLGLTLETFVSQYNCFENQIDPENYPEKELVTYLDSAGFIFWDLLGILSMILIIFLKLFQVIKLDMFTIHANSKEQLIGPSRKYLIPLAIVNHLELSFTYYCHYQIFSFFYYALTNPCIGVKKLGNTPMLFESTKIIFTGQSAHFVTHIFCTVILFFFVHTIQTIYFMVNPVSNCKIFFNPFHIIFRFFSYLFGVWVVCRIGAFLVLQPTFASDHYRIISAIFSYG